MKSNNDEKVIPKIKAIDKLRQFTISPTQQRIEIVQLLLIKHQHLSAEQVLEQINAKGSRVSKATVYNTLGLFAQRGLVKEVFVDPSKVFYDTNTSEHYHIYNVDEGVLTDFHSSYINVQKLPNLPANTVIDGVDVVIRVRNKF